MAILNSRILRIWIVVFAWIPSGAWAQLTAAPRQGLSFQPQTVGITAPPVLPLPGGSGVPTTPLTPLPSIFSGAPTNPSFPIILPPETNVNPNAANYAYQQQYLDWQYQQQNQQKMAALAQAMTMFMGGGGGRYGGQRISSNPSFTGNGGSVESSNPEVIENYKNEMSRYPGIGAPAGISGHTCDSSDTDRFTCMVCNIYFESKGQPDCGQVGVGRTVMTRVYSDAYVQAYHPPADTVCKTVYAHHQYSWTWLYPPSRRTLPAGGEDLERAIKNAREALSEGPDGITNYYNPTFAEHENWIDNCRTPSNQALTNSAACQASDAKGNGFVGAHRFCVVNPTSTRTTAQVMASEGIQPVGGVENRAPAALDGATP